MNIAVTPYALCTFRCVISDILPEPLLQYRYKCSVTVNSVILNQLKCAATAHLIKNLTCMQPWTVTADLHNDDLPLPSMVHTIQYTYSIEVYDNKYCTACAGNRVYSIMYSAPKKFFT